MSRLLADRFGTAVEVVLISAGTQWRETRSSPFLILLGAVQPMVFLLVSSVPQDELAPAEATRLAVGVVLTAFWGSTVWAAAGILRRERVQGTLARTLTTVRDPRLVVLGRSFGASGIAAGSALLTVAVVLALSRQPVSLARPGWLAVGAALVLLSGTAVGMLVGSLFLLTRYGAQLSSALMYPVFLLGGMLIPPALLPAAVRWLSWPISLRWLQQFLVSAAVGRVDVGALAAAATLTAAYAVGAAVLFRRVLDLARRDGSLDLV